MFYHVIVETNPLGKNQSETHTVFDVPSIEEVIHDFGVPYVSNEDFTVDGYNVNQSKLKRFYVAESDSNAQSLVDAFRSRIGPGIVFPVSRQNMINDDKYAKDVTKTIIQSAKKIVQTPIKPSIINQTSIVKDSVFIVHGHDDGLKNEAARFIEKLGLKAIILHEQASSSMTVIEKLEKYTDVGFAITLYTQCDVGSIKSPVELKPRARQNVIFEHGYLTGKLGRHNVCALVEGGIELPSDISGIVFISHDVAGSWKYQIAKELKAAGFNVDLNQI